MRACWIEENSCRLLLCQEKEKCSEGKEQGEADTP